MSIKDHAIASTFDGFMHFHNLEGLTILEELNIEVAIAEGRQPWIPPRFGPRRRGLHTGAPDLTKHEGEDDL